MIGNYLGYLTLAITITAIPGPAVVLTIRNSLRHGFGSAIGNICGNFAAMITLASLSAIGLGAIILTSATLFNFSKILGCLYLIYLGIRAWRTPQTEETHRDSFREKTPRPFLSVFREGFAVGIVNPKAIAFFSALFPQFIDQSRAVVPQLLTLILTIEGISFLVLSAYALLATFLAAGLFRERSRPIFNRLTGTAFIGFGVALLGEMP